MLANYDKYTKKELTELYEKEFGKAPFSYLSRSFLTKYLIYKEQAGKYGDLTTSTQKQLNKLIHVYQLNKNIMDKDIKKTKNFYIQTGTKLVREFKGKRYEVIALDKGYEFNGKIYKSLSAIANEITGTRWNGKIFFGVKK